MPMNDILMTNDTSNNRWKVSYTVDQASTKSKILNTAGTFVDRNIQVEITTPEATFTNNGRSIVVDQGGFVASGTTMGYSGIASFANTATTGTTYTDISNTTAAPVLISGDYLYVNEGYTENVKISLAKLVPDGASATLADGHILSGYSAYNNDGILVAGNIPTKTSANISISGKNVTVPSGYYATNYTVSIADGAYFADDVSANRTNSTVTPSIALTNNASITQTNIYGITTTEPSSGSYFTFTPGATATAWSVTPRANITTAGYIAVGNTTGTAVSNTPTISSNISKYYIPIVNPTFTGGNISVNATAGCATSSNITPADSATSFYIDSLANASASRTAVTYNGEFKGIISKTSGSATSIGAANATATQNSYRTYLEEAVLQASYSGVSVSDEVNPGSITISKETASVSTKTQIDITPTLNSSDINTYYLAVKANAAATSAQNIPISGSAIASISQSGYILDTETASATINTNAQITVKAGNSATYYLPLPTVSGTWGNNGSVNGTATANLNNVNSINTISNISGKTAGTDYWTITPTISTTAASYIPKYTVSSTQRGWLHGTLTDSQRNIGVTGSAGNSIYIPKATWTTSGGTTSIATAGYLPANTVVTNLTAVTPTFDGGDLTVGSTIASLNVTLSDTNNGIYVTSTGNASRTAVLYNGAVNGYINIADNTQALAASGTVNQATVTKKYISAITVPKDQPFTLTTTADTALDTTSDVTITNRGYRWLKITNGGSVAITNGGGDVTITSNSSSSGWVKINAYNHANLPDLTGVQNVVSNGKWIKNEITPSPTVDQGPYYGMTIVKAMSAGTKATITVTGSKAATDPGITQTNTAGTGSAVNIYTANNASTTKPSSGYFVAVEATAPATNITLTKTISTAGYLGTSDTDQITASAATTAVSKTYYVTVPTATFSSSNGTISCATGGYIAAGSNAGSIGAGTITNNTTLPSGSTSNGTINRGNYIKIGAGYYGNDIYYLAQNNSGTITITGSGNTTVNGYVTASVAASTMTKGTTTVSGTTATRGTASWGSGWISSGSLSAATFKNTATSGKTYVDISNTTAAPILTSNGYLYIDQGYTDYLKISLAKLIPNDANVSANNQLLSGYSAYDSDGNLYTGSIDSLGATTYYPSTSDQTIAAGQYLSGAQTFKAVKLTNISAANIKSGTTIRIGDNADDDRIIAVTGTFTAASTVSSGQVAAAAAQIRSGYSAWVNGAEVKGSMGQATATVSGTNVVTATAVLASDANNTSVLSTTNNSGIAITATGGGTANITVTAKTNAVGYSGPTNTVLGSTTFSSGANATTTTQTKYLKEVTLMAPSSGTREFGIKIPDGDGGYMTWVFHVDSNGDVTIDDTYSLTY